MLFPLLETFKHVLLHLIFIAYTFVFMLFSYHQEIHFLQLFKYEKILRYGLRYDSCSFVHRYVLPFRFYHPNVNPSNF